MNGPLLCMDPNLSILAASAIPTPMYRCLCSCACPWVSLHYWSSIFLRAAWPHLSPLSLFHALPSASSNKSPYLSVSLTLTLITIDERMELFIHNLIYLSSWWRERSKPTIVCRPDTHSYPHLEAESGSKEKYIETTHNPHPPMERASLSWIDLWCLWVQPEILFYGVSLCNLPYANENLWQPNICFPSLLALITDRTW